MNSNDMLMTCHTDNNLMANISRSQAMKGFVLFPNWSEYGVDWAMQAPSLYAVLVAVIDHPCAGQDMEATHGTVSGLMDAKLVQYTGCLVEGKAGNKSGPLCLGQHWLRWWLFAWQHQVITWTNVDLSSTEYGENWLTPVPSLYAVLVVVIDNSGAVQDMEARHEQCQVWWMWSWTSTLAAWWRTRMGISLAT